MERICRIHGWIIFCVVVLLCGCATRRDVQILDKETNRLYSELNTQQKEKESVKRDFEKLQRDFRSLQKDFGSLQKEFGSLQKEIGDVKMNVPGETKQDQADLSLRLETLQTEVLTLSTAVEEYKELLKKPSREMDHIKEDIGLRTKILEDKEKVLEEKDKGLEARIKGLEERLKGLEGKTDQLASKQLELVAKQQELERAIPTEEASVEIKGVSARTGDLYKDAYETLQKGNVEGARRKFGAFLKQYPNTELSDNAQFWIGETYYLKRDYEKAILEYEKAITKYPEGDKVPAALFKQALAFLELGDKTNGSNLLKRVIERYPRSDQAEMAKKKLNALR